MRERLRIVKHVLLRAPHTLLLQQGCQPLLFSLKQISLLAESLQIFCITSVVLRPSQAWRLVAAFPLFMNPLVFTSLNCLILRSVYVSHFCLNDSIMLRQRTILRHIGTAQ